jgi:hypothetical protein
MVPQAYEGVCAIRADGNSDVECDRNVVDVFGVLSTPSLSDCHAIHVVDLHSMTVFGAVDIFIQLLSQLFYRNSKEEMPAWSVYLYSYVHMLVVSL